MTPIFSSTRPSFRRRLTLSFVLVAAISSGLLAILSFFLVKRDREASFADRSYDKARLAASLAEARLPDPPSAREIEDLIATLHRRTGMDVIAEGPGQRSTSDPRLRDVTFRESLETVDDDNDLRRVETSIADTRYLVVHPVEPVSPEFYFFFSKASLNAQMSQLAALLSRLWLGVVLVAALIGNLVSRTTLRPIARASSAATALAEGMLDTRLPIERRDEFGAWAASFNEMAAALEQKVHELEAAAERERRFTSDVAHELRTPLSALVTSSQLLTAERDEMGPHAGWAAERLEAEVRRLRRLVEELLEISRLDVGREAVHPETVDLAELVAALLAHHGWSQRVQAEIETGSLSTDSRRLDRVIANLISNAFEHGAEPITVRGLFQDSSLLLEVRDEGPGIPADVAPNIFDRFFKGDSARTGGSGLGLAIARENARLLGGEISFESTGKGTTFMVRLPRRLQQVS